MDRGVWRKPVLLEMTGRPGTVTVADTFDAALLLLGKWPDKTGEAHRLAVMTCRDVLTGKSIPGLARADFIEAALEAGCHVEPETFLEQSWSPQGALSHEFRSGFGLLGFLERELGHKPKSNDNYIDNRNPPSPSQSSLGQSSSGLSTLGQSSSGQSSSGLAPASYSALWEAPSHAATFPAPIGMGELLLRLSDVLKLIMLELWRHAAGMLNVGVRRRQ